jgi:preprotein translocase subunit SecG
MLTFLFIILFIAWLTASVVLILVVLVQSGKGGGLSGLVGASTTLGDQLGATGAEKTLNRWTTYCAVGFLVLNILLVLLGNAVYRQDVLEDVPDFAAQMEAAQQPAAGAGEPEASTGGDASGPVVEVEPVQEAPAAAQEAPAPEEAPADESSSETGAGAGE